jgi:hypothetical protein
MSFVTYPPITVFLLLIISTWILALSFFNIVWLFYLPGFLVIYYILLCRYSCYVKCNEAVMEICYLAPWQKNICISFKKVKYIDYERSGYNMFADKKIGAKLFLPQYCYDRLIIYENLESINIEYVNINTVLLGFNRILNLLRILKKLR